MAVIPEVCKDDTEAESNKEEQRRARGAAVVGGVGIARRVCCRRRCGWGSHGHFSFYTAIYLWGVYGRGDVVRVVMAGGRAGR